MLETKLLEHAGTDEKQSLAFRELKQIACVQTGALLKGTSKEADRACATVAHCQDRERYIDMW